MLLLVKAVKFVRLHGVHHIALPQLEAGQVAVPQRLPHPDRVKPVSLCPVGGDDEPIVFATFPNLLVAT